MIAWWGWILIWTSLVIGMLVMLALGAWWLFRKSLVVFDDLSNLAEKTSILETEDERIPPTQRAVLLSLREVLAREDARKRHRLARKTARHDRRIARAKRISSVDASTAEWPEAWTRPRARKVSGYYGMTRTQHKKRT